MFRSSCSIHSDEISVRSLATKYVLRQVSNFAFVFGIAVSVPAFSLAFQDDSPKATNTDAAPSVEKPVEAAIEGIRYPIDVAADSKGTIFVADRNLPGIWKIVDGKPEIYFQADKKFRTPLNAVRCLAFDAKDRLFAGCSTTTEVYRFDDGKAVPLTDGNVSVPMNMVVEGDWVFVCDLKMRLLDQIPTAGGKLTELAEIQGAKAVAVSDDSIFVLTGIENPILQLSRDGKNLKPLVTGRPFNFPADFVRLQDGTFIVSDSYEKCLWKVADGKAEKWVSDERFSNPVGVCLAGEDLIVADSRANAIFRVKSDGTVSVEWQGTPTP